MLTLKSLLTATIHDLRSNFPLSTFIFCTVFFGLFPTLSPPPTHFIRSIPLIFIYVFVLVSPLWKRHQYSLLPSPIEWRMAHSIEKNGGSRCLILGLQNSCTLHIPSLFSLLYFPSFMSLKPKLPHIRQLYSRIL